MTGEPSKSLVGERVNDELTVQVNVWIGHRQAVGIESRQEGAPGFDQWLIEVRFDQELEIALSKLEC